MRNPKATPAAKGGTKRVTTQGKAPNRAPTRPSDKKNIGVDEAIQRARQGSVNLSPEKAVEMAGQLYSRGRFAEAERVCRQILTRLPSSADAHNILGVSLNAQGKKEQAQQTLEEAVKHAPKAAGIHANLGEILRQLGKRDEAETALNEAVKLDPHNAQAYNNLGIVNFERRNFKEAVKFYRQALELRPAMAEAYNNLGNALRNTRDPEGAIEAYQNALVQREIYPEAYNNLGTLLQAQNRTDEAEHALKKAVAQNPKYIDAYNNLASLYVAQKKDIEALRVLGEALKVAPESNSTLLITGRLQLSRGAHQAAETALRSVLSREPENAEALIIFGQLLHETDRYEEALAALEKAVASNPNNPEGLNFYGVTLKSVGRLDEARDHIVDALKRNPRMFGAYANVSDLLDFSKGDGAELFDRLDKIFTNTANIEAPALLPLHYAYAKALDDRGDHKRALEHYVTGGKMKRAQLDYKEADVHGFFDAIREAYPKEVFEKRPFEGLSDDRPVFIVGMPRSGSTLLEQIVSSHPDVYGAGEVKYLSVALGKLRDRFPSLPRFPEMVSKVTSPQLDIAARTYLNALTASSGEAKRVTDKLLTNYFFVGLLNHMFPNARVIHTRRDPVDTCLSGFTKLFKDDMPHSYDLTELGHYYGKYRQLMEHWEQVLPQGFMTTVVYEDVVADTEKEARRIIDFLGLPWDDRCLAFHQSDRPVKTASVAQVRKPIYKTSVKRWAKYGDGLQPLIDAIEYRPGESSKSPAAKSKAKSKPKAKSPAKEEA